jgi:dihydropteroate synthase
MHNLKVEDTHFPTNKYLRVKDNLIDLSIPKVMGIINCTPDSFYKESRKTTEIETLKQVEKFINEGVDIIDLGGYSSRPGAQEISIQEEINRISTTLNWISNHFHQIPISLDTFRSEVARIGLENGVSIINDISAWNIDEKLIDIIEHYKCPYILMHMVGTPQTMQKKIDNNSSIFKTVTSFLSEKINILEKKGINDIIIDPGFGFGKTINQNYELLNQLQDLRLLKKPILVGFSRKSMIYNKLNCTPQETLNGTTILNTLAIQKGASILRVHDVKEAKEIITLLNY